MLSGICRISVDLFRSYVSMKDILQVYAQIPYSIYGMARHWLRMLGIWASVTSSVHHSVFLRRQHTVSLFYIGFGRVVSNKQNGGDQEENGYSS